MDLHVDGTYDVQYRLVDVIQKGVCEEDISLLYSGVNEVAEALRTEYWTGLKDIGLPMPLTNMHGDENICLFSSLSLQHLSQLATTVLKVSNLKVMPPIFLLLLTAQTISNGQIWGKKYGVIDAQDLALFKQTTFGVVYILYELWKTKRKQVKYEGWGREEGQRHEGEMEEKIGHNKDSRTVAQRLVDCVSGMILKVIYVVKRICHYKTWYRLGSRMSYCIQIFVRRHVCMQ